LSSLYLPLGFASNFETIAVNGADNIPEGDDKQIPLQFVFEPANCRIFYTPQTYADPANLGAIVRDVAWGNRTCAWGGMDTEVGNNGTGWNWPGTPLQVPANSCSARTTVFSVVAALVGVASWMLV
jgi:hypothetical protein